jgi:hypothetical protein
MEPAGSLSHSQEPTSGPDHDGFVLCTYNTQSILYSLNTESVIK